MAGISPDSGLGIALDQIQQRKHSEVDIQAILEAMSQQRVRFQEMQEDRARTMKARQTAGDLLGDISAFTDKPPDTQSPPPGMPSTPMGPPPGQVPPNPPMVSAPPAGAPLGGAPPPGMAAPPPPAAAPGWKPMGPPGAPPPGAPPVAGGAKEPPSDAVMPRKVIDVTDIAKLLATKGIKGQDAFDVLEAWKPFMDDQNKSSLAIMQREVSAQRAAIQAYQAHIAAGRAEETAREHVALDTDRTLRTQQGQERVDLAKQRLKVNAAKAAGGSENLKNVEYVYPKGDNGLPDESQPPIGARGVTKSGKIVVVDANGVQTSSAALGGGTHKEGTTTFNRGEKEKRDASLDASRSVNELLSEKRTILNGPAAGIPVDKERLAAIDRELAKRNPAGGGSGGKTAAPAASGDLEAKAKSAWGSYDPSKYDYRINPDTGNIQRKPKGE